MPNIDINESIMNNAVCIGDKSKLEQFLKMNKCQVTQKTINFAAQNGHIDIVIFLFDYGHFCIHEIMEHAIRGDHLHVFEWLYLRTNNKHLFTLLPIAAEKGKFKIVKWIHKHLPVCSDCSINKAIEQAEQNGHIDIAQWLRTI